MNGPQTPGSALPHEMANLALAALSSQPLGIAVIGKDLRVQLWNPWLEQWSGISVEQAMQRSLDSLFPGLAGSELSSAIQGLLTLITQLVALSIDKKVVPALRVVAPKAPLCVARRSFGITKLHSSRLDWRFFSHNSDDSNSVNRP